ncbi:putative magnesium transporter NIPA4 [Panicum miliaceum]|uniref:Probable magnesium transporter n=1 Tax=Panicum miliaceum TaxID=4540 RepID=A0A3L6PYN8_PANMI|nr:putative magnesium transporter NIPA4 [Panicum miliaceum]
MDVASTASASASGGGRWYTGMSADNIKGLVLALSSSLFIGASFIIKKKGLKKAASSGVRAVIVGEVANFAAYAFAPAILVTPLGALSIIIRHEFWVAELAVLAHVMLREKLHIFGILGCVLCVVGSTTIVLHAPPEREIESVTEVWDLATEPAFMCYAAVVIAIVAILVYRFVPLYGQTHVMVYIGVCSLVGSISDWDRQNPTQIVTEMCGFVTILSGTFLLHKTKDMADGGWIPIRPTGLLFHALYVSYISKQLTVLHQLEPSLASTPSPVTRSMSRRLLELEPSTPTRAIASVSTPSPTTRSRKRMLELEGIIEPVASPTTSPVAIEKGKAKKLKVVRSRKN